MIRIGELASRGMSGHSIKRVRANSARVRRGVYVEAINDPWHGYALLCRAVLGDLTPRAALTGPSAAMVMGLPLIGNPPEQVWVRGATPGRYAKDVKVVSRQLPEPVEVDDLRTVPAGWAVADCARLLDRRTGLVLADAALREGLCSPVELLGIAQSCRGMPGVATLRWIVEFAHGAAESPGESWMRMVVLDLGYTPLLQVPVERGEFRARLDMLLEGTTLVLEFDGRVKYEDHVQVTRVVQAEKERQARLEALGFTVLRVTWAQLSDPQLLDLRIRGALGRSARD